MHLFTYKSKVLKVNPLPDSGHDSDFTLDEALGLCAELLLDRSFDPENRRLKMAKLVLKLARRLLNNASEARLESDYIKYNFVTNLFQERNKELEKDALINTNYDPDSALYWPSQSSKLSPTGEDFFNPDEKKYAKVFKEFLVKNEIEKSINDIIDRRQLKVHIFDKATLNQVLTSIIENAIIENLNVKELIKKPQFRFITKDNQKLSFIVSDAISVVYKDARSLSPETAELGRKKNRENADDYARNMLDVVKKIQQELNITSYRETVKALNERQVPTYRGGDWHLKTLQDLNKRWKDLGLVPSEKK